MLNAGGQILIVLRPQGEIYCLGFIGPRGKCQLGEKRSGLTGVSERESGSLNRPSPGGSLSAERAPGRLFRAVELQPTGGKSDGYHNVAGQEFEQSYLRRLTAAPSRGCGLEDQPAAFRGRGLALASVRAFSPDLTFGGVPILSPVRPFPNHHFHSRARGPVLACVRPHPCISSGVENLCPEGHQSHENPKPYQDGRNRGPGYHFFLRR
jgi:hypothetical protein